MERSLSISREVGHRQGEAMALHNLGDVDWEERSLASAKGRLEAALSLFEEIWHRVGVAATQWKLGSMERESGAESASRAWLEKSLSLSRQLGHVGYETLSLLELSCLSGGDVRTAQESFTRNEERMELEKRILSRRLLWKSSGDVAHLAEAKRLLSEMLAPWSPEDRASALANIRLNREITAAAQAAGL
jgi:hypothetical protein